jgi:fermentation-respiration switch protein FrsA (DUF1100 family)
MAPIPVTTTPTAPTITANPFLDRSPRRLHSVSNAGSDQENVVTTAPKPLPVNWCRAGEELDLRDVTLVGFSMGGGEVARNLAKYSPEPIRSVVFASAVPPFMMQGEDNPQGLSPRRPHPARRRI